MTINFADGTTIEGGGSLGKDLQTIQTVKQDAFSQSLNANTVSNDMGLNVSITPSSSSNKVLLIVQTVIGLGTDDHVGLVILRGGADISGYLPTSAGSRTTFGSGGATKGSSYPEAISGCFLDSPSTTSSTTYSVRIKYGRGANDQNIYLNRAETDSDAISRQRSVSTVTAMEIAA